MSGQWQIVGSAISMYFLAKTFGKVAALWRQCSVFMLPITRAYRGALAEAFSFVFGCRSSLLFSYKLSTAEKSPMYSGQEFSFPSHAYSSARFPALFRSKYPLVFSLALLHDKKNLIRNTAYFILYTILCFSLSAFFFGSRQCLKNNTLLLISFFNSGLASYKIHFVCVSQLWNSPWGFGGSTAGCFGISFMLGKIYITTTVWQFSPDIFRSEKTYSKQFQVAYLPGPVAFVLFMTTGLSKIVWDHIQLWYLQFPGDFWNFPLSSSLFWPDFWSA